MIDNLFSMGVISIGILFIYFSFHSLLRREIVLEKAKIKDNWILEQTFVKGVLILELAGIILVILGTLKLLGIIT